MSYGQDISRYTPIHEVYIVHLVNKETTILITEKLFGFEVASAICAVVLLPIVPIFIAANIIFGAAFLLICSYLFCFILAAPHHVASRKESPVQYPFLIIRSELVSHMAKGQFHRIIGDLGFKFPAPLASANFRHVEGFFFF